MKLNEHVTQYLKYYINLKNSPEYAVLLEGEWGSGKTWFIKEFMDKQKETKFIYVSLNGVSSFSEIEDSFFQQTHPVLSSKGMKIAGKILKGAIKATIKVDLDGDDKSDGSVSANIPDFDLPGYMKKLDEKILVFDDLERCDIEIPRILGYLTQLVENNGLKVIIIANEKEVEGYKRIEPDETSDETEATSQYLKIKEKLIGKSLKISPDINSSLNDFISKVSQEKVRKYLQNNSDEIINLYSIGGYNNLRHLRQSILEYERFYQYLPYKLMAEKQELSQHILQLFLSISIEIKKGLISEDDIYKLFHIDFMTRSESDPKTIIQQIRVKYPIFDKYYHPLSDKSFTMFFRFGFLEDEKVEKEVRASIYFEDENTPDWMKLWRCYNLEDEDFLRISKEQQKLIKGARISNKYELLQISGLLMDLANRKLIRTKKETILKYAKNNFRELKKQGLLKLKRHEEFPSDISHGLKIAGSESKEFNSLFTFVQKLVSESMQNDFEKEAIEILELLPNSFQEFNNQVTPAQGAGKYCEVPILKFIQAGKFVKCITRLKNKDLWKMGKLLDDRYQHIIYASKLFDEISWLQEVHELIIENYLNDEKPIKKDLLEKNVLRGITRNIERLNSYKEKPNVTKID